MVPSAFETCVTAASFVFGPSSFANSSSSSSPSIVDRSDAKLRAFFVAKDLPRHDVGMVLHAGDQDFVARTDVGAPEALRDQIDAFGRAAHENDFVDMRRVEELLRGAAGGLVIFGRGLREIMDAAMDVGVRRARSSA